MSAIDILIMVVTALACLYGFQRLETCILYAKWKSVYVPALRDFYNNLARMREIYEIERPTGEELAEFVRLKHEVNRLGNGLMKLRSMNPRRKRK